ncbi:MAG: hypothetical protein MPW15_09160 [Candidatus Manganitrophus sp.]|nr:hypothetical protein [Candidatus Manganitrophus sp.]
MTAPFRFEDGGGRKIEQLPWFGAGDQRHRLSRKELHGKITGAMKLRQMIVPPVPFHPIEERPAVFLFESERPPARPKTELQARRLFHQIKFAAALKDPHRDRPLQIVPQRAVMAAKGDIRAEVHPDRFRSLQTVDDVCGILTVRHDDPLFEKAVAEIEPPGRNHPLQPELFEIAMAFPLQRFIGPLRPS